MEASFPTVDAIRDIESRQDEVLRKLAELELQITATLATFGDQRLLKAAEAEVIKIAACTQHPVAKAA